MIQDISSLKFILDTKSCFQIVVELLLCVSLLKILIRIPTVEPKARISPPPNKIEILKLCPKSILQFAHTITKKHPGIQKVPIGCN
jgi:hypothetical protein